MEQIINNEISNSKSVQILRAEQTLESSMQRGGTIMSTMKNTMNGTTTNGGNEMKSMQQILTELMEKFGDKIPAEQLVKLAEQEFAAIVELAKMAAGQSKETVKEVKETKVEEKKQETTTEEDEMDKFLEFMYKEVTARGAVTSKVASTLIYKYVDKYGADIDRVGRYTAAFLNYFVTDEGEKHARRLGKDILLSLTIQFGKNLLGEYDTLVELLDVSQTVVGYKTGFDAARAVVGAHKYAKKNQRDITQNLIDYGNKQKLTSMAYAAIDELLDQE